MDRSQEKSDFIEDEITVMVDEIEARLHISFSGLHSRLRRKAK